MPTPRKSQKTDVHVYLPPELARWVRSLAEAERRSVTGQMVVLLEKVRRQLDGKEAAS